MKKSQSVSLAILAYVILVIYGKNVISQTIPSDSLYFGQIPPVDSGIVFAPGIISLPGRNEPCITFSPDGKSAYFYIEFWPNPGTPFIMFSEYKNGSWTIPDTVSFANGRLTAEPHFAFNGNRLYFNSTGAINQVGVVDLSFAVRNDTTWSNPVSMGNPPNNSSDYQYHSCIVGDTSIYFSTNNGRIARCQYMNGVYLPRVILPYPINNANTSQTWGDPFVALDESYMILKSTRAGGYGQNDIYISYKKTNGTWTNPKNLGSKINTPNDETSGDITPDGKYMTYGSNGDLYWVSTSFIDSLRHTNFKPYVNSLIPDQKDTVGQLYSYSLPANTFIDDDGNHTLRFSATLSNGNPLPSWLSFDSISGTFSGIPAAPETLNVKVIATDTAMVSVSDIFKLTIVQQPVDIDEDLGSIPKKLQLYPNYPNPFNPSTTIEFSLPANQIVSLKIYNSVGQLVTTLLDQSMNAGKHQIQWNAEGQASGIYMYCLKAGNNKISRKLLLLK